MTGLYLSVAALLIITGIIGCLVPIVPGPFVAFCGLLCMIPTSHSPSLIALVIFGGITLVVTVLDYVVPALALLSTFALFSGNFCNVIWHNPHLRINMPT